MTFEPKQKPEETKHAAPDAPKSMTAADIGKAVAEATLVASGKGPVVRNVNTFRKSTPDVCLPGTAVIADKNGKFPRATELFHVCKANAASVTVQPVEGRGRGPMQPGALLDQINGGQMVVLHYTPYPQLRDDGVPHVIGGVLVYPHQYNLGSYEQSGDSFYHAAFKTADEAKKRSKKS